MIHLAIQDAHGKYLSEYNDIPAELFINYEALEELKNTKGLEHYFFNHSNPVSNVYGCQVYVVIMEDKFIWLSQNDLKNLQSSPLEDGFNSRVLLKINRNNDEVRLEIPRSIVEFEYP